MNVLLYKKSNKVWINTKNMKTNQLIKKGDDEWNGLYKIMKMYKQLYLLKLFMNFKIFSIFYNLLLQPFYKSPGLPGQNTINNIKSKHNQSRILKRNNKIK